MTTKSTKSAGQAAPQAQINPAARTRAWEKLGEEYFDVIVIGGGVVGSGAALDAATRGLKVALIEARDFAAGTSSRSSKMFHGGLRYLEQLDFSLVSEALHERELSMSKLAPHLVKPLEFMVPLTHRLWERPYMAAGLFLYDTMGGAKTVPRQKHYTKGGAYRKVPAFKDGAIVGGIRYYDTLVDDARHTMTVARTAAHYGATVVTSAQVIRIIIEAGRAVGVEVQDTETGETTQVRGHVVINSTGVWTDEVQALTGARGHFKVRASKGVHIVVPKDRIVSDAALIMRTPSSVLFIIPWGNFWIVGTTDTDWHLDLAHPAATRADIDYLLEQANQHLRVPLTREDIAGVYAGLRPLLYGESESTSTLSREHAVARVLPGLIAIAGGKYTTYRVMGKDAIDAAVADIPARVPESATDRVPLLGADGYFALANQISSVAQRTGLATHWVEHLLNRYGSLLPEVLELAEGRPELLEPIAGADGYLAVEAVYAARFEGARHLEDVMARRTRISIEYDHRGLESAQHVAELIAPELGWDKATLEREVKLYISRVEAEIASQKVLTDADADGLRQKAPEARGKILEPVPAPGAATPAAEAAASSK